MNENEKRTMKRQQRILGVLCLLLPALSVGFGVIGYLRGVNEPGWYESISATYYANSGMMMIGLLFATTIYFWAYRGYDKTDEFVTTISAITAMCVIMFPCSDGRATSEEIVGLFCLPTATSGLIHNGSAIILYISFFIQTLRFTKHGTKVTDQKRKRNIVYQVCMGMMVVGTLFILSTNLIASLESYHYFVLIGECFLQVAYGTAWLVKAECVPCLNDK